MKIDITDEGQSCECGGTFEYAELIAVNPNSNNSDYVSANWSSADGYECSMCYNLTVELEESEVFRCDECGSTYGQRYEAYACCASHARTDTCYPDDSENFCLSAWSGNLLIEHEIEDDAAMCVICHEWGDDCGMRNVHDCPQEREMRDVISELDRAGITWEAKTLLASKNIPFCTVCYMLGAICPEHNPAHVSSRDEDNSEEETVDLLKQG